MALPVECQRLRLGGTISGSTLSGGTLIETSGKNLFVHSTYLGIPGKKSGNLNTPYALATVMIDGATSGQAARPWVLEMGIDHAGEMQRLVDLVPGLSGSNTNTKTVVVALNPQMARKVVQAQYNVPSIMIGQPREIKTP
jgi:hypothetical protein